MNLILRCRSLLSMLLTVCLVSASLWTYSAEAMADALSDEIAVTAPVDFGDHPHEGKFCNHGCHALTHLTGLDNGSPVLNLPDAVDTLRVEVLVLVPTQPRDGPFRPPRISFRA